MGFSLVKKWFPGTTFILESFHISLLEAYGKLWWLYLVTILYFCFTCISFFCFFGFSLCLLFVLWCSCCFVYIYIYIYRWKTVLKPGGYY